MTKYIRLKDSEDEHDDEEEDVGGQDGYLVNGFLGFFANIISIYRRKERINASTEKH